VLKHRIPVKGFHLSELHTQWGLLESDYPTRVELPPAFYFYYVYPC